MVMKYNSPITGTQSTVDGKSSSQMNTYFWQRKALIEAQKEMFFSPLADVTKMPKHYGKTIKCYLQVPLLDDRNVNDQGLDANGARYDNGNLYGSSRDIGTIEGRMPSLTEEGGRVNRVGFTRIQREGTLKKLGFFTEFTQESLDFDSDSELYSHISREMVTAAAQLSEAVLQKELLAGAGVVVFAGSATADAEMTGEGAIVSEVTYEDLTRLGRVLNDNRTPKQTKVITGSRMIDTKTINSGRVLYIGTELEDTVKQMKDYFDNPAFIPVHQYADAGTAIHGEIGTVDQFRIVLVPEMLHWGGKGAEATDKNPGYMTTSGRYDIYPMLCVGDESFTTIGFQIGGKSMKFKIIHRMPGDQTADRTDPFGELGFMSLKWFYGTMILRPERLALIKTLARI